MEKIEQDLSEMDKEFSKNKDLYFRERYEHLLKGIYAATTSVSGLPTTYSLNLMDHNKYEDFAR